MTMYKDAVGGDHQTPTLIVAADDSLKPQHADYVGDGSGEQDVIQAAIDELPDTGGKISLQGQFSTNGTIHMYRDVGAWFNVFLQGEGLGATQLELAAGSNCDIIDNVVLGNPSGWKGVADIRLEGNETGQTSGHGIHCYMAGAGAQYDMRFRNVFVHDAKQDGFHIRNAWGIYLDNCLAEYCGGHGLDFIGDESFIYGFHSSQNAGDGIRLQGTELHLSECRISNVDIGIRLNQIVRSVISNNTIAQFGVAAGARVGIYVIGNSYQSNIHGNTIIGNGANSVYGIMYEGSGTTPTNIYGNTIDGCTTDTFYSTGAAVNLNFCGNTISNAPASPMRITSSNIGVVRDNNGINPVGIHTTPFDNTNFRCASFGTFSAAPNTANQDYTCRTTPCRIISTGGTAVAIVIKDSAGTTICSPGATCDEYLEIGEIINFGNFSAAPTTTVVFK